MPAPAIIHDLVRRFEDSRELYRSGKYNEAQLRVEFLNPFFKALGWDVDNERNYAPQYREVIVEDSLQIEDSAKAPDYAFCLAGQRKFFVEAKKPAVDIKYDIHPAFQLRRYGWNKHLPLSILTDFEEFAVYDCRNKPDPHDSAATARLMLLSFSEYVERWDELAGLFSPQAILSGAFDRYVVETKGKKGTTEVDDAFLKDIEAWRDLLARNIALRNRASDLTERQLNYAVQMTIDRIIFLRICEDRSLEPEEKLLSLTHKPAIYPALLELFRHADEKYNSGLFHFSAEKGQTTSADSFTPGLQIDDKALKEIIRGMYYPCPYIFKEIPVEILGQVYEQFLGKVIHLTPGGQARVEEKPEVRKAGGVYYTPRYIVDYIVKNTVGKLLEGKTPAEASELKVVDPACGSGSFLLGAYQYLLDWHEHYYLEHDPESFARGKSPALVPMGAGVYRLSTAERKRILVNNIYGVDIDAQAVEVTKLSLLLKLLEQESGQLTLGFERVLPDLGRNIRCGNSLIGWDYFKGQLLPDQAEVERVNPFDWQREFPQVFAQGGFDAVIGNPPYIRIQALREWAENDADHYKKIYQSASKGNFDIYVIFIEKGLSLLQPNGKLSFILPHKFFQADFASPVRSIIAGGSHLEAIVHFGAEQVFSNATTYTCLLFLNKSPKEFLKFTAVKSLTNIEQVLMSIDNNEPHLDFQTAMLPAPYADGSEWHFSADNANAVLEKIKLQPLKLRDVTIKIFQGIATSADKIFVLKIIKDLGETILCFSNSQNSEIEIEKGLVKPFLMGKDVHRYEPLEAKNYLIFPYIFEQRNAVLLEPKDLCKRFPLGWSYLLDHKKELSQREHGKYAGKYFYSFSRPQNMAEFEKPKILTPEISLGTNMSIDNFGFFYHTTKVYSFVFNPNQKERPEYWLGLMNSKLLWFFIKSTGYTLRGGYFTFKTNYLNPFPIVTVDFSNRDSVSRHDRMVELVTQILGLKKEQPSTPHEKTQVQRAIAATDAAIDRLVYELYGLSEEEIRIIEGLK